MIQPSRMLRHLASVWMVPFWRCETISYRWFGWKKLPFEYFFEKIRKAFRTLSITDTVPLKRDKQNTL